MAAAGGAGAGAREGPIYRSIGKGSYGVVIKPALPNMNEHGAQIEYPNNVTKLFYSVNAKNKAIVNSERIFTILGNESHRAHEYKKSYKFSRLTVPDVNRSVHSNLLAERVNRRSPLQMLRMSDLGVEIRKLNEPPNYRPLRNVSFLIILQQIRKVFGQIHRLVESNYIHGDVRETNVLVQPRTGAISLIDFDWLHPRDDFFEAYWDAFGFYSNPPESLLLRNKLASPIQSIFNPGIEPAAVVNAIRAAVFDGYSKWTWDGVKGDDKDAMKLAIKDSLVHNINYLRSKIPSGLPTPTLVTRFMDETFNRFDNYGLATTLLILLKYVYLMTPPRTMTSQADHVNILRTRITDNGRKYTDDELERIVVALHALEDLLNRVSSFRIDERPNSSDVLAELDAIIERVQGPPNAAAVVNGGGGARRRRRHQTRKRNGHKSRRSRKN